LGHCVDPMRLAHVWTFCFVQLSDDHKNKLKARYLNSGTKRAIETHLLNYMTYNYYQLPMYAKPGMV